MLKLKYLFNNRDLAEMILKNWDFDTEKMDLLNYFRISANAIYPFENNGMRYFLRFSPVEERNENAIQAELEFINYLRQSGYPAVEIYLSKNNKELEVVDTPWGIYYAEAFKGVSGNQISRIELTENIIYEFGKSLANLHKLSKDYKPNIKRNSWVDQIKWMNNVLIDFPQEVNAKKEVEIISEFLSKLPQNSDNFGLIHFDYESDNVFYDESLKKFNVIDFDDAVYHWFIMDINQTLNSINEDVNEEKSEENKLNFLKGYKSVMPIDEDILKLTNVFNRYADLYGYIRCLRAFNETWNNEPDWMVSFRDYVVNNKMISRSRNFGKEI